MEKNIEEMRRLLYLEEDINEMNASIKSLEEKVTDLKYEKNMMMAGSKLRDLKQEEIDESQKELEELINLRDETDKKFREDSESLKTQMKDSIQNEMDSYQRRDEIEKQRPEIELYKQGITNLEAEVARLEAERQEISEKIKNDALNGDLDLSVDNNDLSRMNAAAALIRSDKVRIADMKSKVEAFNNLKVLEDNIEEYSNLEHELANIDQNFNLEEMIDENYKKPDSKPESETKKKEEPKPDLPPIPELKNWKSEILKEYLSKEEFDNMPEFERIFHSYNIVFKESSEIYRKNLYTELSDEERKTEYEKYIKELTNETKTYIKNLNSYIREEKDKLSQLKEEGIYDLEIELIDDQIQEMEEEIKDSEINLKISKLAVKKDILFNEEEYQKLETAVKNGEIQVDSELSSGKKPQKSEPMKAKNEYDWGDLTKDQIDELWAEGIVPGSQEYKQAYGNFANMPTYEPEVHDIEPESEQKPEETEQTPPQGVDLTEEETKALEEIFASQSKAHENRLAKMLGTAGSWFASKGEEIRDKIVKRKEKVVESDEKEDSNLPTPVKEGNLFTRIGKAIGDKVAQWREEVTAEDENPYYYDEEIYSQAKKKSEERAEKREIKKAEKAKAKKEKKNLEEELKKGVAEDVSEILDRKPEGDTEKESKEQDRPNLVGYDTRDIGFIKKWTQGELRRPVRVDLEDGRSAWLGPDGKIDYEAENNPWSLKENENVNAVYQKEEPTETIEDEELEDLKETEKRINDWISQMEELNGEIVEDTMTDKAETPKPWDVSKEVIDATVEVGKEALKGDAIVTENGNVIVDLDEK